MITSAQTSFRSELESGGPYSAATLAYFAARHRNKLYDLILRKFSDRASSDRQFTQAELARRIGKDPATVNRWLSNPTNWRADTFSTLLLGIAGEELSYTSESPLSRPRQNRSGAVSMLSKLKSMETGSPLSDNRVLLKALTNETVGSRTGSSAAAAMSW